jgi:glucosyl-3-phosphoglycerate synthase
MEYVQDRIATLHSFADARPPAPTDRTAVVVPLTAQDCGTPATEGVFSTLETVAPEQVVVPLRADPSQIAGARRWLDAFDLPTTVLWCTAPRVEAHLADAGLDGAVGKGRDVWLGLGVARDSEYVVVHDADATTYDATHVPRLLFPLAQDYDFVKGYYARVEDGQLYGRLFRLFYEPLLRALADHDTAADTGGDLLDYLGAFRYALAGEFAATSELVSRLRTPRGWGLEIGTLGDAFDATGFAGTAQVDLGVHKHEHRPVDGATGLGEMCTQVGAVLFRLLEEHGIDPDYETLPSRYRACARTLVDQYETDAAFNDLTYDRGAELNQVHEYARAIQPPGEDTRLPAWRDTTLDAERVRSLSSAALDAHTADTPARNL